MPNAECPVEQNQSKQQTGNMFSRWLPRIIGPLILLAIILFSIDLDQALALLLDVDLRLVGVFMLGVFPILILLRSLRWHLIARLYGVRYPFRVSVGLHLAAFSAGFILSDGLSSFVRSFFLYRDGYSASKSVLVPFWDKAIELASLLLMGAVALLILPQVVLESNTYYLVIIALSGIFAVALILGSKRVQVFLLQKLVPLLSRRVKRLERVNADDLLADLRTMQPLSLLGMILYASTVRLVHFAGVYILALALGMSLTFWQIVLTMALASLVIMLPISIAGLGTREAVLIPTLALFGQSPEAAVALSLLLVITSTVWRALGAISWFLLPLRNKLSPLVEDPLP